MSAAGGGSNRQAGGPSISLTSIADAERLFHLAETLAGLGHWRSDFSTGVLSWSPQMYRILGLPEDITPTYDLALSHYHPDDLAKVEMVYSEARQTGAMPPTRLRWLRPDGRMIHILAASEMDGPNTTIGILRDITEQVETERSLMASRSQARAAERSKADLLAVISHEIRSPLEGLLNAVESLRRNPAEAQHPAVLETLGGAAASVMTIVNDMLDFSRFEAGRAVLESVNFDLGSAIRTTVDLFNATATAKGLGLEVHGLDGDPIMVRGDSARLQQLLSNLVGNAIKFTERGTVSVSLSPTRSTGDADYWMIVVRDSGPGIGQDALGRILSRGERVDAARLRLQGATGLGLAISQQLAEAMGGSIAVSSETGRGTVFSVELPFKRTDARPSAAPGASPMRILLAEDNPISRRLMAGLLSREGHRVVAVEDGRRALGAISAQPFDLVLMDMQMPELDGIEATRAIRALDPPACNVPILAISGDSQPERRRIYFEAGVDSFLSKPVVSGQLLEMIARMRRASRAEVESVGDRFDHERLTLLGEQVGHEDAAVLMKMLLFDISDRPRRIAAAVRAQTWELAAAEADALRVLLDSFGSFSLSRLLASIGRQCIRRDVPPAILDEMFEQAAALGTFLVREFGSVPAPIARAIDNVVKAEFARGAGS